MHYEDMTPYSYCLPFNIDEVRNIGWLDIGFDFKKGGVPKGFNEKLRAILTGSGSFKAQVNLIRGVHPCGFCGRNRSDFSTDLGSCEIWTPDENGQYFAAPTQVIHYIEEHDYQPPDKFIRAVIDLALTAEFDGQDIYDSLVLKYGNNEG